MPNYPGVELSRTYCIGDLLDNFVVHVTGCGGYADSTIGAVSTTGHGESFMKTNLALRIVLAMESGNDS